MTGTSSLEYGNRFKGSVAKIARTSQPTAADREADSAAAARYTRWFHGETLSNDRSANARRSVRKVEPGMTSSEIAAVTQENMDILGEDAGNMFMAKLPDGHHMRKSVRASIMPAAPHLGTCKFGEILLPRDEDHFNVTQVFIANFEGALDTSDLNQFCRPLSASFGQMFYGVHIVIDKYGKTLGVDRSLGRDGIAFKTKDITKAFYSVASASTGLSYGQLQARAVRTKG